MGEAPFLLTHVCRAWRQIAISTPALWTTFDIDTPGGLRLSEIAENWFKRARKCPLSVKIYGMLADIDNIGSFMETFKRHSREIQSLELSMVLAELWDMNSYILDFPLLRKLSIRLLDEEIDENVEEPIDIFKNVPLLHEVSMGDIPPTFVTLPWQQLTKFTGELYTVTGCLEALDLLPNLTEFAFAVSRDDDDTDSLELFSHSNLQHLTLFEAFSDFADARSAHILAFLTLPALQTLDIQGVDDFDAVALDSFLLRSSPPLQKLAVHPLNLEGGTELEFNAFTTLGLTELEIWYPAGTFVFLFFEFFGRDPSLLPQLQKLSFLGCRAADGEADVGDILHLSAAPITERRNIIAKCAQLKSFRVVSGKRRGRSVYPSYPEEDLLPFRKLKALGMEVYIGTEERSVI